MLGSIDQTKKTPEQIIRNLAQQHGIVATRTASDDLADTITSLSGDTVVHDEIEDLVVTMSRQGVITVEQAMRLYGNYIETV